MTIDDLAKKLQQWRKNKKTPSERIPEKYWLETIRYAKKLMIMIPSVEIKI